MATERIADMTREELNEMIERAIDHRLSKFSQLKSTRPIDQILASIDRNLWTPPMGAKSSLELLREDRDS